MKKIDSYLIKAFIPPFIVTFFIALFVLVMQFLWLYIDEIMGKGADIFMITELIFYLSVSLFPMALPIAVLISSVMVMGNLAERYELSSFKSAGVPLMRVMLPLMYLTMGISLFSFICADRLIPLSNLKFQSRLYDIRKQKPVLSMEKGIFNDDFQGFTIRVGKKEKDNKTIGDVLIYDNNSAGSGKFNMIHAKSGEMYTTEDKQFMIMNLYEGKQYQDVEENQHPGRYPFLRTSFREWNKVFDLGQFSLSRTDESLFKNHQKMMSSFQLMHAIDSIRYRKYDRLQTLSNSISDYYTPLKKAKEKKSLKPSRMDSIIQVRDRDGQFRTGDTFKIIKPVPLLFTNAVVFKDSTKALRKFSEVLPAIPAYKRAELLSKAETLMRSAQNQAESAINSMQTIEESRVNHVYELHIKFSLALICFVFMFIGAPMGAIVQKGGFGYPILIAIIFFMVFWTLMIYFKNLAKTFSADPVWCAWIPTLIMIPIGLLLTYRAMNDYKLLNVDVYVNRISGFFKGLWLKMKKNRSVTHP